MGKPIQDVTLAPSSGSNPNCRTSPYRRTVNSGCRHYRALRSSLGFRFLISFRNKEFQKAVSVDVPFEGLSGQAWVLQSRLKRGRAWRRQPMVVALPGEAEEDRNILAAVSCASEEQRTSRFWYPLPHEREHYSKDTKKKVVKHIAHLKPIIAFIRNDILETILHVKGVFSSRLHSPPTGFFRLIETKNLFFF